MGEDLEVAERVFKPGNLVFGGSLRKLPSYAEQGIRPGSALGLDWCFTPENICFALLSSDLLLNRYNNACHFGPDGMGTKGPRFEEPSVGIIVNTDRLLESYRDQVKAVGRFFWNKYWRERYGYCRKTRTVFNVPLDTDYDITAFRDEVRIFPNNIPVTRIDPSIWEGLVVKRSDHQKLLDLTRSIKLNLPVFSTNCHLIATN